MEPGRTCILPGYKQDAPMEPKIYSGISMDDFKKALIASSLYGQLHLVGNK